MPKKFNKKRIALWLAAIGPGLIAANADNDAGGITTCSVVGARYGYSMLWVLAAITLSLAITQEMGARMGAVTGKGFGGLIREKFGARWSAFAIIVMLIANLGTNIAEFAGVAASLGIFGIPAYISVPLAAVAVYYLVTKFDYKRVQRVFLISSALYLTYVLSGSLAHPNWGLAVKSLVTPSISFNPGYLVTMVALIGTTITPWGQFFIQSYIVDKGLRADDLKYARADVFIGAFFTDFISFFIIVACAATIWEQHGVVNDAAQAATALAPLAGRFASSLFAFGLLNASLLGAAVLPLTSSYATCEAFGWEAGLDKTPREAPAFFTLCLLFIVVSSLVVLIPHAPLLTIILGSQVVNGTLLPIILIFVLKIINDSAFMGKYTNSRIFNTIAWITVGGLILMTVLTVFTTFFPGLG
ncbi:MAG TPA: divalent metal cation transporter [Armatimonadota bacterium]